MKIPLNEIRGLDRRVRNQMDPKKLEELSDSIKEIGLLQPVKVRKNGHGYTLVFGHRRVQAAKAAGLKEIECIVDDVPDDKLLTQALAENVIREDMKDEDIAEACETILNDTKCTQRQLEAALGWTGGTVAYFIRLRRPEIRKALAVHANQYSSAKIAQEASAGTGNEEGLTAAVVKKAVSEDLTGPQTRRVAEVVKRAHEFGGAKAVQRVLSQRADAILRAADSLPERKSKPKSTVREVKGRVLFQWIKDPRVILAEEGLKSVSAVVSLIARSEEDRPGAKIVLKNLRKLAANVLSQLDAVIAIRSI